MHRVHRTHLNLLKPRLKHGLPSMYVEMYRRPCQQLQCWHTAFKLQECPSSEHDAASTWQSLDNVMPRSKSAMPH